MMIWVDFGSVWGGFLTGYGKAARNRGMLLREELEIGCRRLNVAKVPLFELVVASHGPDRNRSRRTTHPVPRAASCKQYVGESMKPFGSEVRSEESCRNRYKK